MIWKLKTRLSAIIRMQIPTPFFPLFPQTNSKKSCLSSSSAVGRSLGSGWKQLNRKSFALADTNSGISGCCWYMPTLNMAASGVPSSVKGGLPVSISTTVHPRDHMSACATLDTENNNNYCHSSRNDYAHMYTHNSLHF